MILMGDILFVVGDADKVAGVVRLVNEGKGTP